MGLDNPDATNGAHSTTVQHSEGATLSAVDNPDATNGAHSTTAQHSEGATLSAVEMQDQMDQFTNIMQQKFLLGEDNEYLDYSKIDNDETLDDHWQREASHDAEEKYFAEDWGELKHIYFMFSVIASHLIFVY